MNLPNNIEKSGFRKGEYVMHTGTGCLRIEKGGKGWRVCGISSAYRSELDKRMIGKTGKTLADLARILEDIRPYYDGTYKVETKIV